MRARFLACTVFPGLLALPGMLALGACSGKDAGNTAATNLAGGEAPAAVAAARMPRPGLWEMTVTAAGLPQPMKISTCVAKTPPGTNPFAPPTQPGQSCSKNAFVATASGYTIDMTCTVNNVGMDVKGTVGGDFDTKYQTRITTRLTGANLPAAAQQAMESTIDATYVGACPADMKPGDSRQAS